MLRSALFGAVLATVACTAPDSSPSDPGDDRTDDAGDDGVDQGSDQPQFQVLLTDAPGDFDEVWVDIDSVEVQSDAGWLTITDQPQSFDLLTLQNDVTAALGGVDLTPGHYGQLRLMVSNSFVVVEGEAEDMKIASGAQTGIKINLDADIADAMQYTVVVDFDANKSVKATGQGWLMTPVIHVKDLVATPIPDPADEPGEEGGEGDEGGEEDTGGDDGGAEEPVE
jgi:hypothetical protein